MDEQKIKIFLQKEALSYGFSCLRITSATSINETGKSFLEALAKGYYGEMSWIAETKERRLTPKTLWPEVESIIMLGFNYAPDHDPRIVNTLPDRGAISVYARNCDYHDVLKGRMKQIAGRLVGKTKAQVKVFVDTAPVQEKLLAVAAGLGWQGKHSNVVSRDFGSWLFLGAIFTDLVLPYDESEVDHCGSCQACLQACPTQAFPKPYQLDARKCISYLTIELKTQIPHNFRKKIGNRIYGCDACLAVCPWNKFAKESQEIKFQARKELNAPELKDLLLLKDAEFRQLFSKSPIKRIGRGRFIRNCLVASGNSKNREHIPYIKDLLEDNEPLIRSMALWALAELSPYTFWDDTVKKMREKEKDKIVLQEWDYIAQKYTIDKG